MRKYTKNIIIHYLEFAEKHNNNLNEDKEILEPNLHSNTTSKEMLEKENKSLK